MDDDTNVCQFQQAKDKILCDMIQMIYELFGYSGISMFGFVAFGQNRIRLCVNLQFMNIFSFKVNERERERFGMKNVL